MERKEKALINFKKLNNLLNLLKKIKNRDCYYFEVGANDGIHQSNTLHLEKKKWKGILVEANPNKIKDLKLNRPSSKVFNYALVANKKMKNVNFEIIDGFQNLTSKVYDYDYSKKNIIEKFFFNKKKILKVKSTTAQEIINMSKFKWIDFLSVDVEGYELEVLKGYNFNKAKPSLVLIEINSGYVYQILNFMLKKNYILADNLGPTLKENFNIAQDYLFIEKKIFKKLY